MNPFCVPFATTNMGSAILSMDLGWMGPNYSISTACATSNFCILNAANHIIRGEVEMQMVRVKTWFKIVHLMLGENSK
nr:3-oxoacyl-[acyl-carrier-protein] synthase II, chloroplastic-like isoform X7 [Ipomoea trifida]